MTEQEKADDSRIYEVGYTLAPSLKDDGVESVVGAIREAIDKAGGNFLAEGAPSMVRLTYPMVANESGKRVEHDRGYFGWIKFETGLATAQALGDMLSAHASVMRHMIFRTVREDTRAKYKAPTLREVKRTDTLQTRARRVEEPSGPVSEADLEKALQDLTKE